MLVTLFTVCLVVFVYLHVVYQLKTSNDLELFELAMPEKSKLEEACGLRQPLLLDYWSDELLQCTPQNFQYDAFDVNVVDHEGEVVPLSVAKAHALFEKSVHYTERNAEFLKETMLQRVYEKNDAILRPPMVSRIRYDLLFGSPGACTKLRYSDWYRNYFWVASGEVTLKLTPPRNAKYLQVEKDYLQEDFYSKVNPWEDVPKVKFLETVVKPGHLVYVPAYWWYSFKFGKDACLLGFQYRTMMNVVATLPDTVVGILQRQNTTMVTLKPAAESVK
jgi:ribosomal protein L16 Arg81 hydroxylase